MALECCGAVQGRCPAFAVDSMPGLCTAGGVAACLSFMAACLAKPAMRLLEALHAVVRRGAIGDAMASSDRLPQAHCHRAPLARSSVACAAHGGASEPA
jgi:hypothetical protein